MQLDDVIQYFGSQTAIAKALGLTQPSISIWRYGIPQLRQIQLERASDGKLKADPACYGPPQ